MITVSRLLEGSGLALSVADCRHGVGVGAEECADGVELVLPLRGAFTCVFGREAVVADVNTAVILDASRPYRVAHRVAEPDTCAVLSLSPRLVAELGTGHPLAASARLDTRQVIARRRVVDALERGEELEDEERALALAADVLDAAAPARRFEGAGSVRRRHLAVAAKELLAVRRADRLRLDVLAGELDCSPFHLCRTFSAEEGVPLHAYLRRLRVREALARLEGGERDLARLAGELGFADHAHFTRSFRAEMGMPPSAWRAGVGPRRPH